MALIYFSIPGRGLGLQDETTGVSSNTVREEKANEERLEELRSSLDL